MSIYKISFIGMFFGTIGQLKIFARALTVFLFAIGLQACSNDLSRSAAEKILKEEKYPQYEAFLHIYQPPSFTRRNDVLYREDPFYNKLESEGFITQELVQWKRGMPDYPGQNRVDNHMHTVRMPTKKAEQYLAQRKGHWSETSARLVGGQVEFDSITGITKIDENSFAVEFKTRFVMNEIGAIENETRPQDINNFVKNYSGDEVKTALFRKYDDGWRKVDTN